MRCQRCGYVGFDHLKMCKKCGADLTAMRDGLGFIPVKPTVPSFLGALTGETSRAAPPAAEAFHAQDLADDSLPEIELEDELVFVPDEPAEAMTDPLRGPSPVEVRSENDIEELSDEDLTIDVEEDEAERDLELDFNLEEETAEAGMATVVEGKLPEAVIVSDEPVLEEPEVELDLDALDIGLIPDSKSETVQGDLDADAGLEIDYDYKPSLDDIPPEAPTLAAPVSLDEGPIEFKLESNVAEPELPIFAAEEEDLDIPALDTELGITLEELPEAEEEVPTVVAPSPVKPDGKTPQSLKIMSDTSDGMVIEISEEDLEDLMIDLEDGKLGADHKDEPTPVTPLPKTK